MFEGANALSNASVTTLLNLGLISHPIQLAENPTTLPNATTPQHKNFVSLHTAPNCPLKDRPPGTMTGTVGSQDCSGLSNGNIGCGVEIPGRSFGGGFNENGGGIYAMYRDLKKWAYFVNVTKTIFADTRSVQVP